jgi:hypothetical protein
MECYVPRMSRQFLIISALVLCLFPFEAKAFDTTQVPPMPMAKPSAPFVLAGLREPPIPRSRKEASETRPEKEKRRQGSSGRNWRHREGAMCYANDLGRLGNGVKKSGPVGGSGACGFTHGVVATEVSGVVLSPAAKVDCPVMVAFQAWLEDYVQPAARKIYGSRVKGVRVAASYACRSRNNQRGARLSEHGFGNAIDISEFYFDNGIAIDVLNGWRKKNSKAGRFLREVWKGGCKPFRTVIGPYGDRFHLNHFHFDLARRGKSGEGRWCK